MRKSIAEDVEAQAVAAYQIVRAARTRMLLHVPEIVPPYMPIPSDQQVTPPADRNLRDPISVEELLWLDEVISCQELESDDLEARQRLLNGGACGNYAVEP